METITGEKTNDEKVYAKNEETGKEYVLKEETMYKQYPHLAKLKAECETVPLNSLQYWKLRCTYLEKSMDETYSLFENNRCYEFYRILALRTN